MIKDKPTSWEELYSLIDNGSVEVLFSLQVGGELFMEEITILDHRRSYKEGEIYSIYLRNQI